MGNPTAAMLVIGDEILSGRTQDTNTNFLAVALTEAAIDLKEVRVVSDDQAQIIGAVNDLRKRWDNLFTSGGIGPTHDDITADAIAVAFGVGISVRDDARAIMQDRADRMGIELNEARLRMARIPDGAVLIVLVGMILAAAEAQAAAVEDSTEAIRKSFFGAIAPRKTVDCE